MLIIFEFDGVFSQLFFGNCKEKPVIMLGKSPSQNELNLFRPVLAQIINPEHELVLLADRFPWKEIETEFSSLYSTIGTRSKPIRLMTGLIILKKMFNYSDEKLVKAWIENPYYQYFCGEKEFRWLPPCSSSELAQFRKRVGEEGLERISELFEQHCCEKGMLKWMYSWLNQYLRKGIFQQN